MLIDRTYFIGEISIPNWSNPQSGVGELIDYFISIYEPAFLKSALGMELYDEYKSWGEANPLWLGIVRGAEYSDGSVSVKWDGLVPQPSTFKISPIADYIYYWFMRNNISQTTAMGEVKGTAENAILHTPEFKMEKAYNSAVDAIYQLHRFLKYSPQYNWSFEPLTRYYYSRVNTFNI